MKEIILICILIFLIIVYIKNSQSKELFNNGDTAGGQLYLFVGGGADHFYYILENERYRPLDNNETLIIAALSPPILIDKLILPFGEKYTILDLLTAGINLQPVITQLAPALADNSICYNPYENTYWMVKAGFKIPLNDLTLRGVTYKRPIQLDSNGAAILEQIPADSYFPKYSNYPANRPRAFIYTYDQSAPPKMVKWLLYNGVARKLLGGSVYLQWAFTWTPLIMPGNSAGEPLNIPVGAPYTDADLAIDPYIDTAMITQKTFGYIDGNYHNIYSGADQWFQLINGRKKITSALSNAIILKDWGIFLSIPMIISV